MLERLGCKVELCPRKQSNEASWKSQILPVSKEGGHDGVAVRRAALCGTEVVSPMSPQMPGLQAEWGTVGRAWGGRVSLCLGTGLQLAAIGSRREVSVGLQQHLTLLLAVRYNTCFIPES